MDKPIISVIIPIYNAEKYLERAVNSILGQTIEKMELILVDDGSKDGSGRICDSYGAQNERIHVIHKENGGVSTARNAGIEAATGRYLSFLDADDYLDKEAYEEIMDVIEKTNPDCIDFGWKYISDTGEITQNINGLEKEKILEKEEIRNKIIPLLINLVKDDEAFIYDFIWNKIFKTEIIRRNNISFDSGRRIWEDRVFLVKFLKYSNSFYSMNRCYYNYVSTPNSLSRRYDADLFDIIIKNFNVYRTLFHGEYDFENQYSLNYWCHSIENMIMRQLRVKDKREEVEKNIKKILKEDQVIHWYKNREPLDEFEKEASELAVSANSDGIIRLYLQKVEQDIKHEKRIERKYKIRSMVKKIIKGDQ